MKMLLPRNMEEPWKEKLKHGVPWYLFKIFRWDRRMILHEDLTDYICGSAGRCGEVWGLHSIGGWPCRERPSHEEFFQVMVNRPGSTWMDFNFKPRGEFVLVVAGEVVREESSG